MQEKNINCAEFVPIVLRSLLKHLQENQLRLDFMDLLICGSDTWSIKDYKLAKQLSSKKTRVINSYGTTETTIDSTFFEEKDIYQIKLDDNKLVPLGRPFPNTYIHILDTNLIPTAPLQIGEIFVAGAGVSQGYINAQNFTEKRFFKNPFNDSKGEIIYKTNDLGYFLPDGNLQFIGRIDNHTKINGQFVDISVIEETLNNHPDILQALVIPKGKPISHLESFIVFKTLLTQNELVIYLSKRLPKHMVPHKYFIIKNIPTTFNKKLERISPPRAKTVPLGLCFEPPYSETHRWLLNLLKKEAGINRIGINDSFTLLGVTSLVLAACLVEIEKQLCRRLSLKNILQAATLNQLTQILEL